MKRLPALLALALVLLLLAPPSQASHNHDHHSPNMQHVGHFDHGGAYRSGTDIAFQGTTGVFGNLNPGGFRLLDLSDPTNPTLISQFVCPGSQSDVSIFRDLVFVSVDAPNNSKCDGSGTAGWEGVRVVSIADRANPVQLAAVATDCGSHTHTLVPDVAKQRLLIYALSYPLGVPTANCSPVSHRKISVIEVPFAAPETAQVVSTPDVSPAIGCHDVTVLLDVRVVGTRPLGAAACITESQIWDLSDLANPRVISHIYNPAINIHHNTTFSQDGKKIAIGDELGGAVVAPGCHDPHTPLGAIWFYDISNLSLPRPQGYFKMEQPQHSVPQLCTAHNFNTVPMRSTRDVLVSAWYRGGTVVVDFTNGGSPRQLGFYRHNPPPAGQTGPRGGVSWSSYWYNGFIYANQYQGSDVSVSRGVDVYRIEHPLIERPVLGLPRLNPQTQEFSFDPAFGR